jgi:hypothetical protein
VTGTFSSMRIGSGGDMVGTDRLLDVLGTDADILA